MTSLVAKAGWDPKGRAFRVSILPIFASHHLPPYPHDCSRPATMETTPLLNAQDPETRLVLKLLRLQVLTPLAVLVNIATFLICGLVISECKGRQGVVVLSLMLMPCIQSRA